MASHNERCKDCKKTFFELLNATYGDTVINYDLDIPANLIDYKREDHFSILGEIYERLCSYRGYNDFVRVKKLPRCDFYVLSEHRIVEFDETQHFTKPRSISLQNYRKIPLAFDIDKWISLSNSLDKHDDSPKYRDEQRAWYDSLRDYSSLITNGKPIIRVFAKDYVWCSLNTDAEGVKKFKSIIEANS